MNNHELLDLIGDARETYVLEALKTRKGRRNARRSVPARKPLLIAAVIALMLLLAGCVAVFLWLQEMSIAQKAEIPKYDVYGKPLEPTEITMEVLSLTGISGSPVQMATKEWYDFCQSYDPNRELMPNDVDILGIPNHYEYTYHCYTQEMVEKLDEIVLKYDLKLLDSDILVQNWQWQAAFEELKIESLFRQDADVEITQLVADLYPPGGYWMDISFQMTGEDTLWKTPVSARTYYQQKDYMAPPQYLTIDPLDFEEWEYTSADGTKLLLALSNRGTALIVADREDAVISVKLTISANHLMSENGIAPTKEAVEQLADAFDYSIKPSFGDTAVLVSRLEEMDEAYWAEKEATAPVVYAGFADYWKENGLRLRKSYYTYYDLDGNGEMDLLISDDRESFHTWVFSTGGETIPVSDGRTFCLLENGGVVSMDVSQDDITYGSVYYSPVSDGVHIGQMKEDYFAQTGEMIVYVGSSEGSWYRSESEEYYLPENHTQITESEAQAIMAQYPIVELTWNPVLEHPLEDGTTVADYLAHSDVRLPEKELKAKYAEIAAEVIEKYQYCRFNLVDINGDGVLDLLLSSDSMADLDPDTAYIYWSAYTYRYGTLMKLPIADFYLCQDGILEKTWWKPISGGSRRIHHKFIQLKDTEEIVLDYITYDLASDTWLKADTEEVIGSAEANAILERYPRLDQGMRPIQELYH